MTARKPRYVVKLSGSDECDDCDGSGAYYIDGEPQKCICQEPQTDEPKPKRKAKRVGK
jgi:hypothetical protein